MKNDRNIYKTAREAAGITQERASELLYCSVESLRAYETDRRIPPDDIVVRMIEIYGGCQYLAYQHLKISAATASMLPEVEDKSLAVASLSLLRELADIDGIKGTIIEITCDDKVGDDQREQWERITKELNDVCGAIFTMICAGKDKNNAT